MNNTSKILGGLLLIALIYIVFLQGCGGKRKVETEVVTITRIDSVTVVDTVKFKVKEFEYVTVNIPVPYYDTVRIAIPSGNYFDFDESDCEFILKYASIYEDTIKNDTISLYYRAKVRGYLDELTLGYKIFTPFYIEKTTIIETEITKEAKKKAFNGLYLGMDVGIGKDGFKRPTPVIEVSTNKVNYNLGYNVVDKEVRAGIRIKIGK